MDKTGTIVIVVAALAAAIVFIVNRFRRLRARRPMMELLSAYFRGEASLDQIARRAREVAPRHFTSGDEFQSLAVAAFQSAAEAKLARKPHSMKDESELLHLLAALRTSSDFRIAIRSRGGARGASSLLPCGRGGALPFPSRPIRIK